MRHALGVVLVTIGAPQDGILKAHISNLQTRLDGLGRFYSA